MMGVFQAQYGQWFVWCSPFSAETQARLVTDTKPKGEITINDFKLAALFAQVQIFAPNMDALSHIRTSMDNTTVKKWDNCGSVNTVT